MKKFLSFIASLLLLAGCSSPKYAYYFDHYDYNSGKKSLKAEKMLLSQQVTAMPETSPLHINKEAVTASAESRITNTENINLTAADKTLLERKYSSLTRAEKKEFRKELKAEVKKMIKARKSGESITAVTATKVMDQDLKMALIFGVVGVILSIFGGVNSLFWILGTIAIVVGLVFLIIWLAKQ